MSETEAGTPDIENSRRGFLTTGATATLSASAVLLLAGCQSGAMSKSASGSSSKDMDVLNFALGLEHEAIGIYQLVAESGLLTKPVLKTAVLFQGHHKGHRDALAATVRKLGGAPAGAKSQAYYKSRIAKFPLRNQKDVLELALKLEGVAANEYIKAVPQFSDPQLAKVASRLVADETMHWTVYAQALGKPLPGALSFGA